MIDIIEIIKHLTSLSDKSIKSTVQLLEQEATVPFIARYRKAVTGGLDEEQIRAIQKAWNYAKELNQRKQTILKTIEEQGKLTDELKYQIEKCLDSHVLEDLYLPYKPKRKTKAVIAMENGLGPLAEAIQTLKSGDKNQIVREFVKGEVYTPKEAITGAQYIIAESITEDAQIRAFARKSMAEQSSVVSKKKRTDHPEAFKFDLYDDFSIDVAKIKPHQTLALNRGEKLGILTVGLHLDEESLIAWISKYLKIKEDLLFYEEYQQAIKLGLTRYLLPSIEREIRNQLTEVADLHASKVFSENLKNLLMQPPMLNKIIMGIDPGFSSGCKVCVIDENGNYLEGDTIYPVPPRNAVLESEYIIQKLVEKHQVEVIAIGNGTASRETEQFIANTIKKYRLKCKYLIVNEAGASVYSASPLAKKEFPHLDASQRGNISIARRVQDPLAELVKIDPKSIGVGLYQHDIDQNLLESELKAVVESTVNEVGVDLNTASSTLLSFVSGLSSRIAENIVEFRAKNGAFKSRKTLLEVKGVGEKVFEQAAGFLRIREGIEFLDNTAIHPESYEKVYQIADFMNIPLTKPTELALALKHLKNERKKQLLEKLNVDVHTFDLIVENLSKPGRDPREDIQAPLLRSDVLTLEDLKIGMVLSGTVRNVVDFGAFVDIGLKNDALLHVSRMNIRKGISPSQVLSVGDVIQVSIEEIDLDKKRVGLALVKD